MRPDGVLLLADVKRRSKPVTRNGSASSWDIGDGVACLEFHSKMNAIDPDTLDLIDQAIGIVAKDFKALVVYNEGENFSVGANVGIALFAANVAAWPMIEDIVAKGQKVYRKLKHAPFPVVAAPFGLTLGGGCEVCLNADAVQAHAETYIGLVETGVGVVPAWTGSTELLTRWVQNKKRPGGPIPPLAQAFETIGMAKVAKSAFEAKEMLFLRETDGITMNRDRLLADAKAKALALVEDYRPPEKAEISLPGPSARLAMRDRGRRPAPQGRRDAARRGGRRSARRGALGRRHRRHRDRVRRRPAAARARGVHDPDQAPGDARPARAHARDRQAASELTEPAP